MATAKPQEVRQRLAPRAGRPVAVLVHGADRGGVVDLCRTLAANEAGAGNELGIARLADAQKDRLYTEFSSIPMFGDGQVVWLSASGDGAAAALEPILASSERGNLILIDSDALPRSSKLRKLCESSDRALSVAVYEETIYELRERLAALFADARVRIDQDALEHLAGIVSRERSVGNGEVEKLLTYAHGESSIALEDVMAVCVDTYDASLDDLLDSVFGGALEDVERFAAALQSSGARNLLGAALSWAGRLNAMMLQLASGQSPDQLVKHPANGVFFRRQAGVARQLRLWSPEAMIEAEKKIGAAILQARRHRELEPAITSRTLLAVGWLARSRSA